MSNTPVKQNGMRSGGVTLQDVARRAGVASSTASYVLNNKPKPFGDATRARILAAARELDYRPNMAARSLVTNRTNIIALWVPDVTSAFSARVIDQIQRQAWQGGYEVMIGEIHAGSLGDATNAATAAHIKQPLWNCDGVIAFLASACRDVHLDAWAARSIPMVSMGTFPVPGTDFVGVELFSGTREAVGRLIESGRRKIGYLVPADADFPGDDRREAYWATVCAAGYEPIVIPMESGGRAAARATLTAFLNRSSGNEIDALFCYNDDVAIGAYRALLDARRRIPEDVAIVGCDGIEDVLYLDRPLSTLVLPIEAMCRTAWERLAARLIDPDLPPQRTIFNSELQLREST